MPNSRTPPLADQLAELRGVARDRGFVEADGWITRQLGSGGWGSECVCPCHRDFSPCAECISGCLLPG